MNDIYAVIADGIEWEDSDGRAEWNYHDALGVAECCESKGYAVEMVLVARREDDK